MKFLLLPKCIKKLFVHNADFSSGRCCEGRPLRAVKTQALQSKRRLRIFGESWLPLVVFLFLAMVSQGDEMKMEPDWENNDSQNFLPLGIVSREQILSLRVFHHYYLKYLPKDDPVKAIHSFEQPLEIKVFFGDWCKDSKKHVPAFVKTMEIADNKMIQVTYINVSTDKRDPTDLLAGWDIRSVPTFVVLLDGMEVGRMIEAPKVSVDHDLSEMVSIIQHPRKE